MGWITRDLPEFLAGRDPVVRPRTRFGRFLPTIGVLAGFLLGVAAYEYYVGNATRGSQVWYVFLSILIGLSIAMIASYPLLAWRVAFATAILAALRVHLHQGTPWTFQPVQLLSYPVILFMVALRHRRGVVIWAGASALLLILSYVDPPNITGLLIGLLAVLATGDQIRRRREVQRDLAQEAERTELAQARQAVSEQRNRIAREMHDVVAHHMSLIAVRAETAVYRIEGVPPAVAEELQAIAGTSREALTEMRRLLGVLRDESVPLTEPQPTLDELSSLVHSARDAGVSIAFRPLPGVTVPPSVGLAAYRIVQEALSNARRHAAGALVTIRIARASGDLAVFVRNEPTGNAIASDGRGHGILGMRERAAAVGGTLSAGPVPDGGYEVVATLPLEDAA